MRIHGFTGRLGLLELWSTKPAANAPLTDVPSCRVAMMVLAISYSRRQTSLAWTLRHEAFLAGHFSHNFKSFRTDMKRGDSPYSFFADSERRPANKVSHFRHIKPSLGAGCAFCSQPIAERKQIPLFSRIVLQLSGRFSDHSFHYC